MIRRVAALVALAIAAALLGLPAASALTSATLGPATIPAPMPNSAVAAADLPVEVLVDAITPTVLAPGEDLRVRVTLRNNGADTIAEPQVRVSVATGGFISRSSLDTWRQAEPTAPVGQALTTVDLSGPLRPGQETSVTVLVAEDAVPLANRNGSWGAYGMAVQVLDEDGVHGQARTFLLWYPPQEVTPTTVSVLVPITGPAVRVGDGQWTEQMDELTRTDGRLDAVLTATTGRSSATWALDPWLIEATATGGPAPQAWSSRLLAGTADREVQLLPATDPDVVALAHAGALDLLTLASEEASAVATATPGLRDARTDVLLPAVPLPDLATAALTRDRALVVGPGELLPPSVLTYTPSGRTTVATAAGEATVLVPDERLSDALVTGRIRPFTGEASTLVTPATSAQDLLAELATVTRERPIDPRHLLITVPRVWEPDPAVAAAQLTALESAPWVQTAPVSTLVSLDDPAVDRGTLPPRVIAPDEVSAQELAAVGAAMDEREELAGIAEDPAGLLSGAAVERLAPASVGWRADPEARSMLVDLSRARTDALRSAITVEPGADVNLLATAGALPVQVVNTLEQPVTLLVGLRPADARLVAEDPVEVTIAPDSSQSVPVPVHAVQSADVNVTVELRTPGGYLIDDTSQFTVRVRAEWESIGTAVIAVLLAVGLVVGLVRTIRRGRAGTRARPQPESGPDTLSPEEAVTS